MILTLEDILKQKYSDQAKAVVRCIFTTINYINDYRTLAEKGVCCGEVDCQIL